MNKMWIKSDRNSNGFYFIEIFSDLMPWSVPRYLCCNDTDTCILDWPKWWRETDSLHLCWKNIFLFWLFFFLCTKEINKLPFLFVCFLLFCFWFEFERSPMEPQFEVLVYIWCTLDRLWSLDGGGTFVGNETS